MTALVTNAGTHPEPAHIAAALAGLGMDVHYYSTMSWSARGGMARVAARKLPFSALIQQRLLPGELTRERCHNLAYLTAIGTEVARRIGADQSSVWLEKRNNRFSHQAASIVRNRRPSLLVAQQTNAGVVFGAAPADTHKVLNYPIAHHRQLLGMMTEEKKRWPKWADLAQGAFLPEDKLHKLDVEVSLADRILVASTFSMQSFLNEGIHKEKLICVPLGANTNDFFESTDLIRRSNVRPKRDAFHILFVGQANQRKGFIDLLDAMSRVAGQRLKLTVVGQANQSARDVARHYGQNVEFAGSQPKASIGSYYRDADLFVLPSVVEGFGLSALEAMLAGTPVLVSDNTFGTDIVVSGQNGFVTPSREPEQLAAVLRAIVASDLQSLREVGIRGAETAQNYTWASYRRRVARELSQLLGTR